LSAGAEVNAVAALDFTPLDAAIRSGQAEIAEFLRAHGGKEYGEL